MVYRVHRNQSAFRKVSQSGSSDPYAHRRYTDRSFYETRTELDSQRSLLDNFLTDNDISTPCRSIQVVRDFCETEDQAIAARLEPKICLDDCKLGTKKSREVFDSLTTDELYRHLRQERFDLRDYPNADYRKISIRNLNAKSILVLAQTAAHHQRDALRDAFSKHISCSTSLRIHEPVDGFVTPRLELHLPFLTLREVSSESHEWKARGPKDEGKRWLDIPLPASKSRGGYRPDRFLISESHTSIVLSVWDRSKWAGYAFFKGISVTDEEESGEEAGGEDDGEGLGDVADELAEENDPKPKRDIFAPDGDSHEMYADDPIRDPRRYFLRITGVWMSFVVREYRYLVEELEAWVKAWQEDDCCRFLDRPLEIPKEDIMQLLHRIINRKHLLCHVRTDIAALIQEWDNFNGSNGDAACLRYPHNSRGKLLLKHLNASFVELRRFEQVLATQVASCEDLARDVKLHIGFESQRYLSEGNRINLESNKLQNDAYILNLQSNQLQRETQDVNLHTQRMSRRTTAAAEKTSHTTRTNVLMIWITTPCLVALQYFSADKPIFSFFERNPRNFGISLCILALAFPILTWGFDLVFEFFAKRFRIRKPRDTEDLGDVGHP